MPDYIEPTPQDLVDASDRFAESFDYIPVTYHSKDGSVRQEIYGDRPTRHEQELPYMPNPQPWTNGFKTTSKYDGYDSETPHEVAEYEAEGTGRYIQRVTDEATEMGNAEVLQQVAHNLETGFADEGFQEYLDSDDHNYELVQVSPALVDSIQQFYGNEIGLAEIQSFIYYHKLTAKDVDAYYRTFLGEPTGSANMEPPGSSPQQRQEDTSNLDSDVEEVEPRPAWDAEQEEAANEPDYDTLLDNVRVWYFQPMSDQQWQQTVDVAMGYFETLPDRDKNYYSNLDPRVQLPTLWRDYTNHKNRIKQQIQQSQRSQPQQQKNRSQMFTADGRLKWSAINNLSNVDYERQADKIQMWINSGRIDYQQ